MMISYSLIETTAPTTVSTSTNPQSAPRIAATDDGTGFAVTWTDASQANGNDVWLQHFGNTNGVVTAGVSGAVAASAVDEQGADLSWSEANGEYIVAYEKDTGGVSDLRFDVVTLDTAPGMLDVDVDDRPFEHQEVVVAAASGPDGGSLIGYSTTTTTFTPTDAYTHALDGSNTPAADSSFRLGAFTASGHAKAPSVSALSTPGDYVVAIQNNLSPTSDPYWIIEANGVTISSNAAPGVFIPDSEAIAPQTLGLSDGKFVVTYLEKVLGGTGTDYMLRMDIRGADRFTIIADDVIVSNPTGNAIFDTDYSLSRISEEFFAVTYSYTTTGSASSTAVHASIFDMSGNRLMDTQLSQGPNGVATSDSAGLGNGTMAVVWTELAAGGSTETGSASLSVNQLVRSVQLGDTPGEDYTGDDLNEIVTGDSGANTINTMAGNDNITGGIGADTMIGGEGNDIYDVENSGDVVTELTGEGDDIVYTSTTYNVPLNVEVLIMSGSSDIDTTGTAARDIIIGNAGSNIINGAGGFDVMQGGAGDDVYAVDNSMDAVIEAAGGGYDNVYSAVDYEINETQEIESAILTGSAVVLRGSDSGNQLFGNDQVNVIDGRGGTDYMLGLGGADIFQINLEAGAVDVVGDFSKAEGDRMAFTGFNQATTFVNQASATSFEVRDTRGTATLDDDTVQTFQLNDSYGSGSYTQGALEFNVDYYFG